MSFIFIKDVADRYNLESRHNAYGGWMVIFDTVKKEYVKQPGSKRAYAKFRSSFAAFQWLREMEKEGKL